MKKFNMVDEEFICIHCKKKINKLNYTARDHCPYCLYSIHLDITPGDRKSACKGVLVPIGIEKYNDIFKIIYKCKACNYIHKNIMAKDDNMDLIIELSSNTNY